MHEFAAHGFDNASTNRIVEQAGIGKGMLFHYFGNKRRLFHFLIDESLRFMQEEVTDKLDPNETDFTGKYRQAAEAKFYAYIKNPHMLHFLGKVFVDGGGLTEQLRRRVETTMHDGEKLLFDNIDTSLFRDDLPKDHVLRIIRWSIDGYRHELLEAYKHKDLTATDLDPYWQEFHELLSTLRRVLYKPKEDAEHGHCHDA